MNTHTHARPRRWLAALALAVGLASAPPVKAQGNLVGAGIDAAIGGITTPQIMQATLTALPSCLKYTVTGVCFFLKCRLFYCTIVTSIRVQHYMPDVVVSTYSGPDQHPWRDVGTALAATLKGPGDSIMGMFTDGQADTWAQTPTRPNMVLAKSADAIGNPVGALIGGNMAFEFPDFMELTQFPSTELPRIGQLWAQAPMDLADSSLAGAKGILGDAQKLVGQISNLPGQFTGLLSKVGNLKDLSSIPSLGDLQNNIPSFQDMMGQASQIMGSATGMINSSDGGMGGLSAMSALICPGAASMFGIDYNSDIDGLFWRGTVPLELLYPGSWIPGVGEVGNGLVNTWGGTYPRNHQLTQPDPVKASAVIAARVASILEQPAQPHIYKRLTGKGNKKYFQQAANPHWQMLYPVQSDSCVTFGENDSLSLKSFGDGRTSGNNGYAWNLWHQYECCQKQGTFLFAVP